MATLDSKPARRKKAEPKAPAEESTVEAVAARMREGKVQMDEGKKVYDKARPEFLALMGKEKKLESGGYVYAVSVPVTTTFDAEGLAGEHPEFVEAGVIKVVVTTTYELDEAVASKAIESDSETEGSPRVTIKAVAGDE